jgi:hypothetical protein
MAGSVVPVLVLASEVVLLKFHWVRIAACEEATTAKKERVRRERMRLNLTPSL